MDNGQSFQAARPGVPAEREPSPVGNAHWTEPEQQRPRADVTRDPGRSRLTATFGTGQPPKGVSGLFRRAAYRLPDYRARRWALLLFADRIDSLEATAVRAVSNPATWLAAAAVIALWGFPRAARR